MTNFVDLTRGMQNVDMVTSRGVEGTQSVPIPTSTPSNAKKTMAWN